MPHVRRDAEGRIQSLHRGEDAGTEWVANVDASLTAFVDSAGAGGPAPTADFGRLDAEFVRVLEDVIDTLIVKNLINITDLPDQAQAKLFARKSFRERVSKSALQLFEPTDFGDVV